MVAGDILASLFVVSSHGLEHRGQDAEPAFDEISPQVGGKLREIPLHHHAAIWGKAVVPMRAAPRTATAVFTGPLGSLLG